MNKTRPWWQNTTIYQVYPRSFYDSNGDGVGDLQGLIEKLPYLQNLGVETLWISPFFASPQKDFGYDISDYLNIDPAYGTLATVDSLIENCHNLGLRIVFDLVLNHTSNQHPWFLASQEDTENAYANWYIWADKPNNWRSMTGGSAWHYHPKRKQYYLATFLPFQPDLNYQNPALQKAIFEVVSFWLQKGVDGFRLDIFNVLFKDPQLKNNPRSTQLFPSEENPFGFFQKPVYNFNLPENKAFAQTLKALCAQYGEKLLLGEVTGPVADTKSFLGTISKPGLDLVFSFEMLRFDFSATYFYALLEKMETHFAAPNIPVYTFNNHDRRRSFTRLKAAPQKAALLAAFLLTVRGVPSLYYGEEIGMEDLPLPYKTALDPIPHKNAWLPRWLTELFNETLNRDDVRTPMQWNATKNAGFSVANQTWLPVHPNFTTNNVAQQEQDTQSLLGHYKSLLALRKAHKALHAGSLRLFPETLKSGVLTYVRSYENQVCWVFLNFSEQTVDISANSKNLVLLLGNVNAGMLGPSAYAIFKCNYPESVNETLE